MRMLRLIPRLLVLFATASAVMAVPAKAQFKPNGPVTIVAPFAAGGTVDQVARELGRGLEKKWGVTVLIENRPGAGNILAATAIGVGGIPGVGELLLTHIPVWTDVNTVVREARQTYRGPVEAAAAGATYSLDRVRTGSGGARLRTGSA